MKLLKSILAGAVLALGIAAAAAETAPPEHVQVMKDLGKYMGAIRKGVDVEKNANMMAEDMKKVGAFWKTRNSKIAMDTCGQTRKGALAAAKAAAAGDKEGIAAGMKEVGAGCKGCHEAHREKISDTEYKIK